MKLSSKIQAYLDDHKTAWAESTLESERYRLASCSAHLDKGPVHLYQWALDQGMKPYSIKTLFIRVTSLEAYANCGSAYADFMRKHANRFKHAYVKRELKITFEEALTRIASLEAPYKTLALEMLQTGLRISETSKVSDGHVIGKGAKRRRVYGKISVQVPRSTFRAKLKAVGLNPHALRKLCATRLAERGATPADLCKIFGWSSIETAYQYLQAKEDDRLLELVQKSTEGP